MDGAEAEQQVFFSHILSKWLLCVFYSCLWLSTVCIEGKTDGLMNGNYTKGGVFACTIVFSLFSFNLLIFKNFSGLFRIKVLKNDDLK